MRPILSKPARPALRLIPTKIFVDTTKTFVDTPRSYDPTARAPSDRRRTGHPARPLGARPEHRPAGPRRARPRTPRRLHDRAQAAPDHGGEGARRSRRARPHACVPGPPQRTPDATAARA